MPQGLVFFGQIKALALYCFYVQQLGPGYVLQALECLGKLQYVVPVYWSEITKP